ncbi:MAG: hypothetical protein WCJ21_03655, partial [Planctomycetota bacterium]
APRRTRPQLFGSERLEQRLALTVSLSSTPLSGSEFCYNILIDDTVDSAGLGRDAYLKSIGGAGDGGRILIADNPAFDNAITRSLVLTDGRATTFFVSSGSERDVTAGLDTATLTGTVVGGTPTVTGLETTKGLHEGMVVTGAGIPSGTTIVSIDSSGSDITLSANVGSVITTPFAFGTVALASNGTTVKGSPDVTGISSTDGLLVGMPVTGTGIPANTTILSINPADTTSLTLSAKSTATSGSYALTFGAGVKSLSGTASAGSSIISAISSTTALLIGMPVTGPGIPDGATIVNKTSTSVTLSAPSTSQRTQSLDFAAIELSGNTVSGSTTVTGLDPTLSGGLQLGMTVTGANIPESTTIRSISSSGTSVVLSNAAFTTGSDLLTFGGGVSGGGTAKVGSYAYSIPSETLNAVGKVSLGNGLSFDFTAYPQTATPTTTPVATLTVSSVADWTAAGYGTPTIAVGGSSLNFTFVDTESKPKNVPAFILSDSEDFLKPGTSSQSFTVAPGLNFNQRLTVDLQPDQSRININSPWQSTLGSAADPGFYSAYGRHGIAASNLVLYATSVNINQLTTSTTLVGVGGTQRDSGFTGPTQFFNVNAAMGAPHYSLELAGTINSHGLLAMASQAGSFLGADTASGAGDITLTAEYTDVQFLGQVNASNQSYLLQASGSADQYQFTTRSPATGVQAGSILGNTVVMTLGQPAGGTVDIKTQISNFRFDAGIDASSVPYAYTVNVEETDALTVDAVGASSAPMSIRAGQGSTGSLTILGSAIRTVSDLVLEATDKLTLSGPVSTGNGDIRLTAPNLAISTTVTAGGNRNVSLNSTSGTALISSLVQAGGAAKESVRVATTSNIGLSGLQTIDGVSLTVGNRVLVKSQTIPAENGIYVVAANNWSRASDANTSALLSPGFTVAVIKGTQGGSWTFRNAANPIVGQTGLSFVPTTATVVFNPVLLATTASDKDLSLSGAAANPLYVGTTTTASPTVTGLTSTAGLIAGLTVLGTDNATAPTIASFNAAAGTLTLSSPVTTGGANKALAFTTTDPSAYLSLGSQQVYLLSDISLLSVGMSVTGVGIPANTTILAIDASRSRVTLSASATAAGFQALTFTSGVTGVTTIASAAVTSLSSTVGLAVGQTVTGAGIAAGTTILSIDSATAITLSTPATAGDGVSGIALAFTGGQIDGQYVIAGDRVLVQNQIANPATNGIYIVKAGAWVRASDADNVAELRAGAYAFVKSGAANAGKGFALANDAVEVGTTPLYFCPFQAQVSVVGNTTLNSPVVKDLVSTANLAVGQSVAGPGIPAAATILAIDSAAKTLTLSANATATTAITGNTTITSAVVTNLPSTSTLAGGMVVTGTGIPAGTTIKSVDSVSQITLTAPASATSTGVLLSFSSGNTGTTTLNSQVVTNVTSTTELKIGMLVTGTGIPAGTTIQKIDSPSRITLSAQATATGTGIALVFSALSITGNVTITSPVVTNLTSTSALAPGMFVSGFGIAAGSTIKSVDSATQITLSAPATATGTGSTLTFTVGPITGTTQSSSAVVINLTSTSALAPGMFVSGTGIPAGTTIKSVDSVTQITLSAPATAPGIGVALTFTAGPITGTTQSSSAVVSNLTSTS